MNEGPAGDVAGATLIGCYGHDCCLIGGLLDRPSDSHGPFLVIAATQFFSW
jgi:hypothetical protein